MDEEASEGPNVGGIDRLLRIAVGSVLLWVFATRSEPSLTLLGIAPLLSGLLAFCPVYFYAGVSTRKKKAEPRLAVAQRSQPGTQLS